MVQGETGKPWLHWNLHNLCLNRYTHWMHKKTNIISFWFISYNWTHHLPSALRLSPYLPTRRLGGIKLRLKTRRRKNKLSPGSKEPTLTVVPLTSRTSWELQGGKVWQKLEFSERPIGFRNDINAPHRLHSGLDWRTWENRGDSFEEVPEAQLWGRKLSNKAQNHL